MWEAFRIIGLIFMGVILFPALCVTAFALFWLDPNHPEDTGDHDFLGEEETTQEFLRTLSMRRL